MSERAKSVSSQGSVSSEGNELAEFDGSATSSGLIAHIQGAAEHQKALLARELHDELGGLLVGAVMDVAWAEQHLTAPPAELRQKLVRARQTLSAAIDLKRRLIEELRPTLLDNVGLFAALRWHVEAISKSLGIGCSVHVPSDEPRFLPNIPIAIFRIVQEAFAVTLRRGRTTFAQFDVTVEPSGLTLRMLSRELPNRTSTSSGADSHSLSAIEYRVAALGGDFMQQAAAAGDTCLLATFPSSAVLNNASELSPTAI